MLFQFCSRSEISDFVPTILKCDNLENPAGTGKNPEFSWLISSYENGVGQSAYQIVLDADERNLNSENKCAWNSGKVTSPSASWIPYGGNDLKSATKYFWKVRIWDNKDKPSIWSETSSFITGLINNEDWAGAKWIGYEELPDSLILVPGVHGNGNSLGEVAKKRTVIPYFRKEFLLEKKILNAYVFVSGLGQYELYINGKKIGNRFLSPGWTDYRKTCYYNTFDVTEELKKGKNAIGTLVGNGFYNINRERYRKLVIASGAPEMILKLLVRHTDGTEEMIISDESWKTAPSPVTFTSIYGGEDYDARLEENDWCRTGFDDTEWKPALPVRNQGGILQPEKDYPVMAIAGF